MKTLKELRAELAAKKLVMKMALTEYNSIRAIAAPTAEQTARATTLNGELDAHEETIDTLAIQVEEMETAKRRAELVMGQRAAAGEGGRANDPDPTRTFGFKSVAEFAVSVRAANLNQAVDERLTDGWLQANAPASYQQNLGSSGEGFLVPPEYSKTVWDMALDSTDLLGMCSPEPTASNTIGMPTDETTPWGSAGVQAYWGAEAGLYKASIAAIKSTLLQLHKLYAFVGASDEVLSDAPLLRNRLTTQAGKALAWRASESIFSGTGAGMPTGYMASPALITVAKDGGQATGTISVNNLANMLAHMLRIGGTPVWIANQDILPQLIQLAIGNYPVWIATNSGLQDSPWDGTILGYPVKFTEHAQTLSTTGDITLVNFSGYYAATKQGGIDFAESMHLYFDQGITAFRWTFRLGGQPILSKPVQPAKGATTKSHFVALQTR